jgi:Mn-dependent DtxR family transcriptional regulator
MARNRLSQHRFLSAIEESSLASGTARTKDVSECLGVAPATVTERFKDLAGRGLVYYRPYHGASLTTSGREHLRSGLRRIWLLERFFLSIGMRGEAARLQAERMGPMIGDESYSRLLGVVVEMEASTATGSRDRGDGSEMPKIVAVPDS